MQQRVAIARALAGNPSVLLLDEPLGALDRKLREEMQLELRQIQSTVGTTFIYVTHDQEEALALSDRLVVMRDGRIEQSGPPADVYDSPSTLWVAGFVGSSNQLAGVVRSVGPQVEIDCDVTRIVADHVHDELRPGDRVVAVVRPRGRRALRAGRPAPTTVNRVEALIEDRINVGADRCERSRVRRADSSSSRRDPAPRSPPTRCICSRAARRAALGAGRRPRVRCRRTPSARVARMPLRRARPRHGRAD